MWFTCTNLCYLISELTKIFIKITKNSIKIVYNGITYLFTKEEIENNTTLLQEYDNLTKEEIIELKKEMEIPETLKDMGVNEGDEIKLAPLAQEDPSTGANPLEMTVERFQELILNCISGKY